jgi:hypothetical protein
VRAQGRTADADQPMVKRLTGRGVARFLSVYSVADFDAVFE